MKRPVPAFLPISLLPILCRSPALLRWSLALLSLSHVVGCADESANGPGLTFDACAPLEIGIAPALTAEQMQGVTDALAMWNQAAGTALAPMTVPTPTAASSTGATGSTVMALAAPAATTSTPLVPLTFQVAAPPFHGLYDNRAGRIYINLDLTDIGPLRITIAHEIGHAFGLPHVNPPVRRSLMNAGNTTIGITPDDVDALAAIWGRCPTAAAAP